MGKSLGARSDRENGCLQVVPKSHGSSWQHDICEKGMVLSRKVDDEQMRQLEAPVDVELDPGGAKGIQGSS